MGSWDDIPWECEELIVNGNRWCPSTKHELRTESLKRRTVGFPPS